MNDRDLSIPLQRGLWIHGRSHPTGMGTVTGAAIDVDALKAAAALL